MFWMSAIKSDDISGNYDLHTLILDHAAAEIRGDRELMVVACREGGCQVYDILDAESQEHRPIVAAMVESTFGDGGYVH